MTGRCTTNRKVAPSTSQGTRVEKRSGGVRSSSHAPVAPAQHARNRESGRPAPRAPCPTSALCPKENAAVARGSAWPEPVHSFTLQHDPHTPLLL
jgi:hypothetical protein